MTAALTSERPSTAARRLAATLGGLLVMNETLSIRKYKPAIINRRDVDIVTT